MDPVEGVYIPYYYTSFRVRVGVFLELLRRHPCRRRTGSSGGPWAGGTQRRLLMQEVWLRQFCLRFHLLRRGSNFLCASLRCLRISRQWHRRIRAPRLGCCSKETRCLYRWCVHRDFVPPRSLSLEVKVPLAPVRG